MKKEFGKWYLGLDIGTDSVGWAVTDESYKVLKFNGKAMWGIHLFESGKTAEDRRLFRCARRRTERRKQRLRLLAEMFQKEIQSIDPKFFERLQDSKFLKEDKMTKQKNTLFFDPSFTDKEYHQNYPTIYHLRSDLVHSEEKHDIRLVYLALHHILKHRGHFLYEGQDFKTASDFENVFSDVLNTLSDYGIDFGILSPNGVKEVLKNRESKLKEKKSKLRTCLISRFS